MPNEKRLITAALPYANGPLHFGHIAGAYLPADCYARFQRLLHRDVLFLCGSDEYGVAITMSAEIAGRTPQEHVNIYHQVIKDFFQKLNISFDHYARTSAKGHIAPVQKFFLDLLEKGLIEARETDQLYSEKEQRFLADRYVTGICPRCGFAEARGDECPSCGASYEATDLKEPRSKLTGSPLIKKKTKHWFLLLEKSQKELTDWLSTKNWKSNVVNFVKGYIDELHARAITRDSDWGVPIPLPGTEGKVLYVWFDAPIGYLSAAMEWAEKQGNPEQWKDYWCDPETKLVQFIGKDNIPFHAVIFPAMVMGQSLPLKLVDELPANEFFMLEGRQFSKSDGWTIDLDRFFQQFTTDQLRYAIAANAPETADASFTWKDFQMRCNAELLAKLGNLVNRVLVFAKMHCEGKVPPMELLQPVDSQLIDAIRQKVEEAKQSYEQFKVRRCSQILMEIAQLGNVYFDNKKPWQDAKSVDGRTALETTIACCLECLKALALVANPLIPETSEKIWGLLGFSQPLMDRGWDQIALMTIPTGQQLGEPVILFQRVEDAVIDAEIAILKEGLKKKPAAKASKPEISYEEFSKLDLRVGRILEAEPVPKSKKLLKLKVDIGNEVRQIVAGIAGSYVPEAVIGKQVVVVANLKPSLLMGVESQGMLLAGKDGDSLTLVPVEGLPLGSPIA
jgi:methionyl-tRNA synthetase